eukprot:427617-Prymnesium_polylepis.2
MESSSSSRAGSWISGCVERGHAANAHVGAGRLAPHGLGLGATAGRRMAARTMPKTKRGCTPARLQWPYIPRTSALIRAVCGSMALTSRRSAAN